MSASTEDEFGGEMPEDPFGPTELNKGDIDHCPVCAAHSETENLNSQGMVLTGMKALFDQDGPAIQGVYDSLSSYDGHTAIGMCAAFMHDLCLIAGITIPDALEAYRDGLNEAQAKAAE